MSLEASRWAWEQRGITPTAKLVLLALADHLNGSGECWPSLTRLADMTGLARSTVAAMLGDLETSGRIHRERGGKGQATRYRLAIETPGTTTTSSPTGGPVREPVVRETDQGSPTDGLDSPGGGLAVVRQSDPNRKLNRKEPLKEEEGESPEKEKEGESPENEKDGESPETPSDPVKDREAKPASGTDSRKPLVVDLPDWLDGGTWSEFLEHRRKLKAPMTDLAQRRAVRELGRLLEAGHDPEAVLDQSIVNGWKGLFPVKGQNTRSGPGLGASFEAQRIGTTVNNLRNLFGDEEHGATNISTDDDLPGGRLFDGDFERESRRVLGPPQRNAR